MRKHLPIKILFYTLILFTILIFYKTFFEENNYEKNQIVTQITFENLLKEKKLHNNNLVNDIHDIRLFLKDQYLILSEIADPHARNILRFTNYNDIQTKISILSNGFIITSYIDTDIDINKIKKYHEEIEKKYKQMYFHPILEHPINIKINHYTYKKIFKFDYSIFLILSIFIDLIFFSYFRRYLI